METDKIAVQNTFQNLVSHRQDTVDFTTREGSVQEEAQLDILLCLANRFSKHGWKEHEMIIVYPYKVIVLNIFGYSFGEELIGGFVSLPSLFVECDLTRMIVEQGPKDRI